MMRRLAYAVIGGILGLIKNDPRWQRSWVIYGRAHLNAAGDREGRHVAQPTLMRVG